jgi:uncharacterized repeat protein (TIGR01451 family)
MTEILKNDHSVSDRGADSRLFEELTHDLLSRGISVRFEARGGSMSPAIRDGDLVEVTPVIVSKLRKDDIVLAKSNYGFRLHRIVRADHARDIFITRGDCGQQDDPALTGAQILGLARAKGVQVGRRVVQAKFRTLRGWTLRCAARGQSVAGKLWRKLAQRRSGAAQNAIRLVIAGIFILVSAAFVQAQVAVDTTTFGTAELTGSGSPTLTVSHTTAGTNRLLLVGVSINITNNTATTVTGVTYGGTALTKVGAHNDAGNTRRVEQWYMLAPPTGTANVVVTVNIPSAVTEGVVAGATTFTGVDQTVPLGTFVSADGANAGYSQLNVTSVVNGMILDTLAISGGDAITVPGPQVSQWNTQSGGNGNTDVTGEGSSRSGAPAVPVSETFNANSNWSEAATPINPSTADIAVTESVATVLQGNNSTYNITVTNNGPSAANSVVLTDTWPTTNMTTVSVTPSAGTTCTTAPPPITCTLPTPLASGATATLTVVVNATASGAYANTASLTDSNTPPDPNTGNNSYTAVATVQSAACATVSQATPGTPTGVVNTYYPGTASVTAGSKSITLGASTQGAGASIAAGNLLLVIQMQDAGINDSNTVSYGNGSTGSGYTALNSTGNFEFVTATNSVTTAGGTLNISGAGPGNGLVFSYDASAATANKGQATFQVILIPQYSTATLPATGLTASPWNGATGGVLALDASQTLNLNSATVVVDGLGFRGAAGMELTGGVGGSNTDYFHSSPAAYTGVAENGVDASKGEGIAGTPMWVNAGANNYLQTTTTEGYPSGTLGTDGSMARGAPGNAGGGGTDADQGGNTENDGGGGGGNGGSGGFGGDSWNTNLSDGGEGGAAFPATVNRVAMGGGGGAGTRNNSDGLNQASSGSAGGGIIIIRAYALTGTATLTANGINSYNATSNDAGGGGGAGGSIIVLSANGGEGGLTLQANGGTGGNAWATEPFTLGNRHGPGGGGGGGVLLVSGTPASGSSVNGGANGLTENPGVPYGATPGNNGFTVTNASISSTSGTQSGAQCTPDLTLTKSHTGNFTRGTNGVQWTIPVFNISPYGASSGLVTVNDTLPTGATPVTATGAGWTCSVSGQTVSCTRSDALAPASTILYPITVSLNVSQSAPASLTNTAVVAGGSELNTTNDTATDVATVVSSADLSITNSGAPAAVGAGTNITYTQVITNNGPSAADNATLVEAIPANTTFISMTAPAGWTCSTPAQGATGSVVCTEVNMAGSTAATFTLVVGVKGGTANGTIISDTATTSSSTIDPNSANNSATATNIVGTGVTNLNVSNAASPNPVQAGNTITYTQVVTNSGASAATGATFSEATPTNTTLSTITPPAGWSCAGFPASACTNPSVAAGSVGTFTVVYTVTAGTASGTTITDTATVNATNQSYGANSAVATDIVASSTQADLALNTAGTPSTVYSGNNITYTQTITNNGPASASGVSFTEATPGATTFESVSPPTGWTCTTPAVGSTGTITCSDPNPLASAGTANIIVVVNVPPATAAGTITASSSVSATTSDPNSANNTTSVSTTDAVQCDLAVTNTANPTTVKTNTNVIFTQVVTNNGPSTCSAGTVTEPTPADMNWVSDSVVNSGGATWTCPNANPTACTATSVPPGSTATITATYVTQAGTAGNNTTDTITVGTSTHDTNTSNNSASVTIGITNNADADLSMTNSGSPNPVAAGNSITYLQTVTNNGNANATTPKVVETIPTGTTATSLTGPAGWTCTLATLTCTDGANLNSGVTTTNFTLVVSVPATAASGTSLSESAKVTSTTTDPNPNNNTATSIIIVSDSAALSITNTGTPVPVQAGGTITYTQVATNAGPSPATSAVMTESTPPNTTFQSITYPGGWSCTTPAVGGTGTITCNEPSFAVGSASFTLVLNVPTGTAPGTAINDTATITSAVADPNSGNNSATAADVVATSSQADLVVTNSPSASSVTAGSNVTYTQTITNNGPVVSSSGMTFTETTPPNTTFQSISAPAGWSCTPLGTGQTGTITCTDGGSLAVGAANMASFSFVVQVVSSTPTGTSITDTATAAATNAVPASTNSASATVLVGSSTSAAMSIVKTGSPNPVTAGTPLTYTMLVTNGGPATATNVIVSDSVPSSETYLSYTATQGSCSEAGGTVTCLLGTMANGGTATVTVLVIPNQAGQVSNTASVTATQDPSGASSTWVETVTQPTRITLRTFTAHVITDKNGANHAALLWQTGGEAHNLGFNVYREENGNRVRMNPSMIAGSALLMRGALPKHAGRSYSWIDASAEAPGASYWLEDVDVNGARTMHGPVAVQAGTQPASDAPATETRMLNQLSQAQPTNPGGEASHFVEAVQTEVDSSPTQLQKQFALAAQRAVKISVQNEGWYSVAQPDLVKAGLDPYVDPASLHLYAETVEQSIQITGAGVGRGGFGPQAAIRFYGTGINTVFSGTRVYWLVTENSAGARIPRAWPAAGSNLPPANFPAKVVLEQHSIYFAALLTADGQNFFGAVVSPTPAEQILSTPNLDTTSTQSSELEVVLQGVIVAYPHDVEVALNGTTLGNVKFTGQGKGRSRMRIPPGLLQNGSNTVTLTAQNGEYDTSLVQSITIVYPHTYVADSDVLKFTGHAGEELKVSGFSSAPTVLDITDSNHPLLVGGQITSGSGQYTITLQVPWRTTNQAQPELHTLLAVANDQISSAAAIVANQPSNWHNPRAADIAMITYPDFATALTPLVQAHRAQAESSVVIPIDQLYDEFNFGESSPFAIREFLKTASQTWRKPPAYLLLNGRASYDPRNYLGLGNLDLVPTRILPSSSLMTASDDWFSDFTDSGTPAIATGRLPAATVDDATTMVSKIVAYEGESGDGPWTSQALIVSDQNDASDNFSQYSQDVQSRLPKSIQATEVFTGTVGVSAAQQQIIDGINSGQLIVNYIGHGSEEQWSGSNIFDTNSVSSLTNSSQLPVFLIMDCLNGFFQDPYAQPLGVALMLAPNGGAAAVLASTGLNQALPQVKLDMLVLEGALNAARPTLGEAVLRAKARLGDPAVRRTYVLFGDPAMRVKQPAAAPAAH